MQIVLEIAASPILQLKPANIMFDPRVVRGNTWAADVIKTKEPESPRPPKSPSPAKK